MMDVVAPQGLRRASRLRHTSQQHLLHQESRLLADCLLIFRFSHIKHIAVFVLDAGDKFRHVVPALVHHRAVGVDQFEQSDILRAERHCRSFFYRRGDAQFMSHVGNAVQAHLMRHRDSHRVDRI